MEKMADLERRLKLQEQKAEAAEARIQKEA
jgi:hypothetical protein